MTILGTMLGRYRIDDRLGEGAMADVYRAHDPDIGRTVAIKVLKPEFARDPDLAARFLREARAAGALSHANIATIYDVGEAQGAAYIAMELVDGQPVSVVACHGRGGRSRVTHRPTDSACGMRSPPIRCRAPDEAAPEPAARALLPRYCTGTERLTAPAAANCKVSDTRSPAASGPDRSLSSQEACTPSPGGTEIRSCSWSKTRICTPPAAGVLADVNASASCPVAVRSISTVLALPAV